MLRPVERSITVSAPQRIAHTIFSTSSATPEETALLPMLALILTRKLRPIAIGSSSTWLMLAGMIARPRATSERTNSAVMNSGMSAPKLSPSSSRVRRARHGRFAREIFAEGDIFHFRRDDARPGEFKLRDELAGLAPRG